MIDKDTHKKIQKFLIEFVLKMDGVDKSRKNPEETPASKLLLIKDLNVHLLKEKWHHRSIVGMLNYLE